MRARRNFNRDNLLPLYGLSSCHPAELSKNAKQYYWRFFNLLAERISVHPHIFYIGFIILGYYMNYDHVINKFEWK